MKNRIALCALIALQLVSSAGAAVLVNADWTVDLAIPEGDPVGVTSSQTFQSLADDPIADVAVDLNISGGYNGGLFAYLVLQDANGNTATEILLNQIGTSPSDPFGSAGAGFNVTLTDSGTVNGDIHEATGIPTGTWQPDSSTTLDQTFGGLSANGTWTLFVADLQGGGGTSTLNSWGLLVSSSSVPEPADFGIWSAGLLVAFQAGRFFCTRKSSS
jgi:subtilisin-like proprotein convertase family protein